jgi:hypothetical protein
MTHEMTIEEGPCVESTAPMLLVGPGPANSAEPTGKRELSVNAAAPLG